MFTKIVTAVAALALLAAACGSDEPAETSTTEAATASTTATPEAGSEVVLTASSLGDILTDEDGNTLYLFVPDNQGPSVCNDDCAANWPPLLKGPVAGDGIDATLLGTATRDDGSEQVTYNGWPLYYFANDAAPGDTNGQGVNDVWYVLDAAGNGVGL